MSKYTVIVHSAEEGGFWSEVLALPGCYSQGETIEETITNTRKAIESHVEALRYDGESVPEEDAVVGTFKVYIT
jgi:predicted RNase H-like HicB family nuclease